MSTDESIKNADTYDLTTFKLLIAGKDVGLEHPIMSFEIEHRANQISNAKVVIYDGDAAEENFKSSNSGNFTPGISLEIQAGYHNDNKTLFRGEITQHKVFTNSKKCTFLEFTCKTRWNRMTKTRHSRHFKQVSESKLYGEITKDYSSNGNGLSCEIDKKSVTEDFRKNISQPNMSDWDFLVNRAERIGALLFIDENEKMIIKKPDLKNGKGAGKQGSNADKVIITYGTDALDFDLELDGEKQFSSNIAYTWDSKQNKLVKIESKQESGDNLSFGSDTVNNLSKKGGNISLEFKHGGELKKEEIDSFTKARKSRIQLGKIQGKVMCEGRHDVKLGEFVELRGFGDRFNGNQAFVSGIKHSLLKGSWKTEFSVGLSTKMHHEKYGDMKSPPASGLNPGINGLQIGKVKKLEGDPEGNHRILVTLPIYDKGSEGNAGLWARMASLDAGADRGTYFRPEVGDEVLLGFINEDVNEAVVLGMLHSQHFPPPVSINADNDLKGYKSRSKAELVFNDKQISVLIKTPAGNQIYLNEEDKKITIEDQNKNKMIMEQEGITVESSRDITIKAPGNITIEAQNIDIKANINLNAVASAAAIFEGKTSAALKGQMVMIN